MSKVLFVRKHNFHYSLLAFNDHISRQIHIFPEYQIMICHIAIDLYMVYFIFFLK